MPNNNIDNTKFFTKVMNMIIRDFNANRFNIDNKNELFHLHNESFNSVYSEVLYSSMYVKDIDEKFSICITISLNKYTNEEYITISCYAAEKVSKRGYLPFYGDMRDYKIVNNSIETAKIYDIIAEEYDYITSEYKDYYEREAAK